MKMIIKHLLLRLICFLYIVLFVVSLVFFILYGHYKRFVITDDTSNDCKINIRVQRIQCTQCRSTHSLLPTNFVPYTQFTYLFIYYIVTLDENDDLITSFEVALQTIRKVKARVIEFWDSCFQTGEISSRMT